MLSDDSWQLEKPINAVVFDCDGTLSAIEGIDELAAMNQVGELVRALTAEAMGQSGINPQMYKKRLDLVYPNLEQVVALGKHYHHHQVPDVGDVIQLLQRLKKTVYVVSAGLHPAVSAFGERLNIPPQQIFAVDIQFDAEGNYADFDSASLLVSQDGKRHIVSQLKEKHETIAHIGDGLNDYVTYDLVTRFIGYGGVYYREQIESQCEFYIKSRSLAPLLPLLLTQEEVACLTESELMLYEKGFELFEKAFS